MFNKSIIAATALSLAAIPGAASAQYYPSQPYYGGGYNGQAYYGQNRCSGTTGTVIGGVAGAVVGSKIAGSRQRYDYYGNRRGGSNATGAIIGGAVGALLGRKVDKDSCKSRNRYNGYNNYGYRY
ncbi:glycine zipper 2TM domain-containing protein [Sphingomonas swuensis]